MSFDEALNHTMSDPATQTILAALAKSEREEKGESVLRAAYGPYRIMKASEDTLND